MKVKISTIRHALCYGIKKNNSMDIKEVTLVTAVIAETAAEIIDKL